MLKFVYVVFLTVVSFLLFIFSKEKSVHTCKNEASGVVTIINDSAGNYLAVATSDNKIFRPASMNEEIVLAAGQKVTICYTVDSVTAIAGLSSQVPVHIEAVTYHP